MLSRTTDSHFSTRLDRGGNTVHGTTFADLEEYELDDYAATRDTKQQNSREVRRAAKRANKLKGLEDADEMKFSHSIQFNAVPDWSSHYIAYSNLKKL